MPYIHSVLALLAIPAQPLGPDHDAALAHALSVCDAALANALHQPPSRHL
jgi:hypothetical protein